MQETELILAAQQGNHEAFAALVEKYRTKMFNLGYSMTRNQETADDIAQEAFIKAYVSLPRFRFKSQFGTWLYRIAVNTAKDFLRKEGKMRTVPFDEKTNGSVFQEDEMVRKEASETDEQKKKILYAALQSLPEKYQVILTLRDIQGFPYGEISEILKISPGTVDSRLHRARKMLRNKVNILSAPIGGKHAV